MKKIVKICLISTFLVFLSLLLFIGIYFLVSYIKFSSLSLNADALTSMSLQIKVYDKDGNLMEEENCFNEKYIKLEELKKETVDAFLSVEDKDFYKHNGINKKRILKAIYNNLKSFSLKEGASTISQQLIKNTHLSNEKTFERKMKELILTKKLEKNFSKDEILEFYLNIIYFGNNCYGIESASNFYFDKEAKDLDLSESALLAGLIKSPNKYSPIKNKETAIKRRNLVLSEMEKDGKITTEEFFQSIEKDIILKINNETKNKLNSYAEASIDEASKILKLPAKQIAIGKFKIHTYQNPEMEDNLINSLSTNLNDVDYAGIVIDNSSHGVLAYNGKSPYKILDAKRQVGSTIKPLLVYAPALNENVITLETEILDEKMKIGEYTPNNANGKFSGYVSIKDAVKKSINTVAIKVLSYIGIDKGKQYAEKLGFTFDEKDNSYALALGGMTYGENIKTLTNAYTVFPNLGKYDDAVFVSYILDSNGKVVYKHKTDEKIVFREDSSYLMTKMLQETALDGTARKLADIKNTEIGSKTGTVGDKNGNMDAYNISITPDYSIGVWCGKLNNEKISISGGNEPTEIVRDFVTKTNHKKTKFPTTSQVTEREIDLLEKEKNHRLVLATPNTPKRYVETALFSRFNIPNEISTNFLDLKEIVAEVRKENLNGILTLEPEKHIKYDIFLNGEFYKTIKERKDETMITFPLRREKNEIKIVAKFLNTENSPSKEKTFKVENKVEWFQKKNEGKNVWKI